MDTVKNLRDHRKHRYVLADKPKKENSTEFLQKTKTIKLFIDFRTTTAHKVRIRLKFKQYHVILTK